MRDREYKIPDNILPTLVLYKSLTPNSKLVVPSNNLVEKDDVQWLEM